MPLVVNGWPIGTFPAEKLGKELASSPKFHLSFFSLTNRQVKELFLLPHQHLGRMALTNQILCP